MSPWVPACAGTHEGATIPSSTSQRASFATRSTLSATVPSFSWKDVRGADEAVRELAVRPVHDEIFLVHARGKLDDLGRYLQKRFIEAAEQGHRPFGEAGILDHQPLVLDKAQPGVGRGFGCTIANDRLPLLMVDDNVAGAQLFGIIRRRADGDFAGAMKAVAARHETAGDPTDLARHQFVAEDRDDPRQRAHPAQAFAACTFAAPAHRLGPGKAADDRGDRLGEHLDRRTAGLVDDGEVNAIAIFQLILRQPGLAEEAFERLRRRAAARPFDFLRLHPRGDFLAAQFEKKVGHSTHPGYFSVQRSDWLSIHALQLPFARSRTRAM